MHFSKYDTTETTIIFLNHHANGKNNSYCYNYFLMQDTVHNSDHNTNTHRERRWNCGKTVSFSEA